MSKTLKIKLFEIAVGKGYCSIYSEHYIIENALQKVFNEMNLKEK